jgi:hypothetical protein
MTDIADTLAERGARYGNFTDHAAHAQSLQDTMRNTAGWANLSPVKRQALTVIADKIARILSGDPEYKDNWHDIQGYAKLAEDRCVVAPPAVDTDEWVEWSGGECPVNPEAKILYRLRDGSENPTWRFAGELRWSYRTFAGGLGDIVAYKVVE